MSSDGALLFKDAATLAREKIDPANAVGMKYVGLEHIEPDSLVLSDYGYAEDVASSKATFKKGDILFGKLRPYFRKVVVAPFDGICSTDIWVVRAKKQVDQTFLYYWMASREFVDNATRGSEGTRMPRAKWDYVGRFESPITDKNEQIAIGQVLKTLDDKIELNRQMCETLEKTAATLFKSWFVDFDPVKAKMEGRVPEGMAPELLDLFPDSFEDSDLGPIPSEWNISKVNDIAKVTDYVANGSFLALKENVTLYDYPEYALYIRTTDANNNFIWNNLKFTDEKSYKFLKKSVLKGRETIISNVGDVGTVFRPPVWFDYPMTLGSNAMAIIENRGFDGYLYWFFKTNRGQQLITSITTGSAQLKFNKTSLRGRKIIVPDSVLLEEYESIEKSIWQKIVMLKSQIVKCSKIRDYLLPKIISGELRVDDV